MRLWLWSPFTLTISPLMWLPTLPPLQNDTLIYSFCLHILSKLGKFHSHSLQTSFCCPYLIILYRSTHLYNSETWGIFLAFLISSPMAPHITINLSSGHFHLLPSWWYFLTSIPIISTVPLSALPFMAVTIIRKVLIVVSMKTGPYHSCVRPFSKASWILWGEYVAWC